ncbi:hypothetical protein [Acetivibrio clariflavus]|nr:hypothetical protein [Acetivibrio clariflavus]
MDKTIKLYFESLIKKYGDQVEIVAPKINDEELNKIPVALQHFTNLLLK